MPSNAFKPQSTTVLLINDTPTSSLKLTLEQAGYTVLQAGSGKRALQLCQVYSVQLMVLESPLPDMSAEELIQAVQSFDPKMQIVHQPSGVSLQQIETTLQLYRHKQALHASRSGLLHILNAATELPSWQALENLLYGGLLQLEGLLHLSGTLIALVDATGLQAPTTEVRLSTGRFGHLSWNHLGIDEQQLIEKTARSGEIQWQSLIAIPLKTTHRVLGVLLVDPCEPLAIDGDLLENFAQKAALAIENIQTHRSVDLDGLTQLVSREYWMQRLVDNVRLGLRYNQSHSLILLDIDRFEQINARFGRPAGDHALAALGTLIHQTARNTDVCGRYGGEEFCLLLPHTSLTGALALAEKLWRSLGQMQVLWDGQPITLTASVGVACLHLETAQLNAEDLLETAYGSLLQATDDALYQAKFRGGNQVARGRTLYIEDLLGYMSYKTQTPQLPS